MSDADIDTAESPALDEQFFSRATLQQPAGKAAVTVSVDADVLAWYRAQGPDYQKRINAALRIYAEAHREAA